MTRQATVTERPILFSAPMIHALLSGRKSQTRRVIFKDDPDHHMPWWCSGTHWQDGDELLRCPYAVGMRLWVRESLWLPPAITKGMLRDGADTWPSAIYNADEPDDDWCKEHGWRKHPSIHMPRRASRITMEITEVRAERLQRITEEDAIAEGLGKITKDEGRTWKYGIPDRDGLPGGCDVGWPWHDWDVDPRKAYARLWDEINGSKHSWASNPWVWCVAFKRLVPTPCP